MSESAAKKAVDTTSRLTSSTILQEVKIQGDFTEEAVKEIILSLSRDGFNIEAEEGKRGSSTTWSWTIHAMRIAAPREQLDVPEPPPPADAGGFAL